MAPPSPFLDWLPLKFVPAILILPAPSIAPPLPSRALPINELPAMFSMAWLVVIRIAGAPLVSVRAAILKIASELETRKIGLFTANEPSIIIGPVILILLEISGRLLAGLIDPLTVNVIVLRFGSIPVHSW